MDTQQASLQQDQMGDTARPQLLVSVRSRAEATVAMQAGVDVLDVKEPARGSLGRSDVMTVRAIIDSLSHVSPAPGLALSMALGELTELESATTRELDELSALLADQRLSYAKIGLAGTGISADWRDRWLRMRDRLQPRSSFRWIAVAYADSDAAQSPRVTDIASAAAETAAAGLLIDTFQKDGRGLLDHLPVTELLRLRNRMVESELLLALAGGLDIGSIRLLLADCPPDIIAVRGAACEAGQRAGNIHRESIAALRETISAPVCGE